MWRHPATAGGRFLCMLLCVAGVAGCFSERAFAPEPGDLVEVRSPSPEAPLSSLPVRDWVSVVHEQLKGRLPEASAPALVSPHLIRAHDGRPVDVGEHFNFDPDRVDRLFDNPAGLAYTAQVIPAEEARGLEAHWSGLRRVAIPMPDGCRISALLGPPTAGAISGSYVVVTHGLFGRQYGTDQRNVVEALRAFGHHVLAVEMRGHGVTEIESPEYPMTFGPDEVRDLLEIDRWLRSTQRAERVGLLAWSVTAHAGLLAAWIDSEVEPSGRNPHDRAAGGRGGGACASGSLVRRSMPPPAARPAYDGGMVLMSPVVNIVKYCDALHRKRGRLGSPLRAGFQRRVAARLRAAGRGPEVSMWAYVAYELRRSHWMEEYGGDFPAMVEDVVDFIDLEGIARHRLDHVRVPVLVVQGADDPVIGSAQGAVDLLALNRNPNCGLVLLPNSGHAALTAVSRSYHYSMVRAFFDPATAPAIAPAPPAARSRAE